MVLAMPNSVPSVEEKVAHRVRLYSVRGFALAGIMVCHLAFFVRLFATLARFVLRAEVTSSPSLSAILSVSLSHTHTHSHTHTTCTLA